MSEVPSRAPTAEAPVRHLGIVLDGNRRWARRQGLPGAEHGHRDGFAKIPEVLTWCAEFGIGVITLWMLSDDNIARRHTEELEHLYSIDEAVITRLTAMRRWRVHHIGDPALLPDRLVKALRHAEYVTRDACGPLVNLAIGYGGRRDLLNAINALVRDSADGLTGEVTADRLARFLSTAGQPDPDLIIRTSGECRTSGFLLWQAALGEWYFSDRLWPDFTRDDLQAALRAYARRHRRLGA
ncbi:(2Z,6E)-farnesyl diphosphate synthase [Streptomyces sp. YIM 121038]|uniref:polyprenyl diphosphate synthase n=1 Tax=Streptomyces sp. YIM 121038 TaxID=2136401 RepID=UPI0011106C8B|nr:polyprenyl diphosphate synthase [Streptomyces sp. YIM 121038]QCX74754.1 (2Z,6E)-farnesyl diphosphate synthase [Streptomyces sp. YIM 121038]